MASSASDQVAFITGAAQGIGYATAQRFLSAGYQVVIADINQDKGTTAQQVLGTDCLFVELDVTSESSWQTAIHKAIEAFGHINVLVNCAGISEPGSIEDCSLELFKKVQDINVDSVFLGCKYGIKAIKNTSGGSIVNIGSTLGIKPMSIHTPYGASKAAVNNITKTAALHCAENQYNIRVNAVHPGAVRTPMYDYYLDLAEDRQAAEESFAQVHPMGRIAEPEDIANAVFFLSSKEAGFITGVALPVDGGFTA
ncbi:MAG: glucose 1-dehydrogenase [Pseudomonadales bacterium]|nr:glucose 1-dehydrogenase [Pseudomonadales bacterium]